MLTRHVQPRRQRPIAELKRALACVGDVRGAQQSLGVDDDVPQGEIAGAVRGADRRQSKNIRGLECTWLLRIVTIRDRAAAYG
ncbi:MAG: hypothetical protein ACJ790_09625 [Myxococcaceae bacterium]